MGNIVKLGPTPVADMTGATESSAGAHGLVPAPAAGAQGKFLRGDGSWANAPYPANMTGATSSAGGASGLVPAPLAGEHKLFLKGDGTWGEPDGVRLYVADLDTVTNTSGSYTHTSTVQGMTSDLKAVLIECSNPEIFRDKVTVTTGSGAVTLTCADVAGTSTVKVSFAVQGNANPLNSTEYAALDARIGDLSDLTTTDKSSVVGAVNSVNSKFPGFIKYSTRVVVANLVNNPLTLTKNSWLCANLDAGSTQGPIYINGIEVYYIYGRSSVFIPVKAGDVVTVGGNLTTVNVSYFEME